MKTQKERQQDAINYFLTSKLNAQAETLPGIIIVRYEIEKLGKRYPAACCFYGNSAKTKSFYYSSEERRETILNEQKKFTAERIKQIEESRKKKKEFKTSCKIGDIFCCSWGYDQTNVDYYKLIGLKNNQGTFIEIGSKVVDGSYQSHGMACDVIPDPANETGEPFKKFIHEGEVISINSYQRARRNDGRPMYNSWYA